MKKQSALNAQALWGLEKLVRSVVGIITVNLKGCPAHISLESELLTASRILTHPNGYPKNRLPQVSHIAFDMWKGKA
jgi:hypothetical protein